MSDIEGLELELQNEKLLLQDYKGIYDYTLRDKNVNNLNELCRSIHIEYTNELCQSIHRDYDKNFALIVKKKIKEIETNIDQLQEKIGGKG